MASIRWLHLANLRFSADRSSVLEQLRDELSVASVLDLILLTGDLTMHGHAAEFDALDRALDQLLEHLQEDGCAPTLLAVPGNHDLFRPGFESPMRMFYRWHESPELRDMFWNDAESPFRRAVARAFEPFTRWAERRAPPALRLRRGILPGDFTATIKKEDLRLGIAGLNSAFLHIDDRMEIDLDPRQLSMAAGGDTPSFIAQHHAALLMTHHPPDLLAPSATRVYHKKISPPGRFFAHLLGHVHDQRPRVHDDKESGGIQVHCWTPMGSLNYAVGLLSASPGDAHAELTIWPYAEKPFKKRVDLFYPAGPLSAAPARDADPPLVELLSLRDVLAELYPHAINAQRLAREASINADYLPTAGAAVDVWHAVLCLAHKRPESLKDLEEITRIEIPGSRSLTAAWEALSAASGMESGSPEVFGRRDRSEEAEKAADAAYERLVRLLPSQLETITRYLRIPQDQLFSAQASQSARVAEIVRHAQHKPAGLRTLNGAISRVSGSADQDADEGASALMPSQGSLFFQGSPFTPFTPFTPTESSVRRLLAAALPEERDFDAFCLDQFPDLYRRFTNGMDRTYRTNELLKRTGPEEIIRRLRRARPLDYAEHADTITYED